MDFIADEGSRLEVLGAWLNEEGAYMLKVKPDSMAYLLSATFTLLMDGRDGVLISLGEDDELLFDVEEGLFQDSFQGEWLTLPDGQLLCLYLIEEVEGYNLYTSPVQLNSRETNLRVLYGWNEEAFRVIGAWNGIDAHGASGKEISGSVTKTPLFPCMKPIKRKAATIWAWWRGYRVADGLLIQYAQLPPADYYYSFILRDLFGFETYTDFAIFEVDAAGEIWFYTD